MAAAATCPNCQMPLPESAINAGRLEKCPACPAQIQADLFPAIFRKNDPGKAGETILVEGEASCFYHPQKRASIPCASCGRFLCSLCDVELNGEHICPVCLQTGQQKGKLTDLEQRRTLYDSLALHLSFLPFLITGPAAIIIAIYAWNKPLSLVRRTRIRIYTAIILGLAQTVGWVFVFMQD
jgi:hypothetical protein